MGTLYNWTQNDYLPEPVPNRRRKPMSTSAKCSKYFSRLFHFNQMDFQFAAWQVTYLFIAPEKVYKKSMYRKQTKNQYSRDDPAFLVILTTCIIISAIAMSLVLHLTFWSFIKLTFWLVVVDCILSGVIVATIFWLLAIKYMKDPNTIENSVEWGYAFDVHLNAFFPPLIILHIFQTLLYSCFISQDWFISRLFGNSLWLSAVIYYCYITYLGYRSLPYLRGTKYILYSLVPIFLIYLVSLAAGINIMQMIMNFYEYRLSLYDRMGKVQ